MKFQLTEQGMVQTFPNLNPFTMGSKEGWFEGWLTGQVEHLFNWIGGGLIVAAKFTIINAGPICMTAALASCVLRIMGAKRAGKWVWWSIMGYLILLFIGEVIGI